MYNSKVNFLKKLTFLLYSNTPENTSRVNDFLRTAKVSTAYYSSFRFRDTFENNSTLLNKESNFYF